MTIFNTKNTFAFLQDVFLLIVRCVVGFAMLSHGFPKLQMLLEGGEIQFYEFLGLSSTFSLGLAVFAEFVCSIFIILGLFTRVAASFLIFTMCVAVFAVHGSDPFEKQELGVLYLCIFLLIFVFGAGKFSIDALINKKKNSRTY